MASKREYLDFILEQLSDMEDISFRRMMGEYRLRGWKQTATKLLSRCSTFTTSARMRRRIRMKMYM